MFTVKKSINNNMLLVVKNQQEMILFGKGIGFGTKPNTIVNLSQIEQVFIPLENLKSRHFLSLTDTIPAIFFEITHDIITMAQAYYTRPLNSVLFFMLAEHLCYAIEREKKGNHLGNKLSWEVKRYYQKEYSIGLQAKNRVDAHFNILLPDDEAVHIAFHLINASGEESNQSAHQQVQLVNRIAELVRYKIKKNIDITTINYNRFITHLRYFAERVICHNISSGDNDDFYHEMLKFHPEAMSVAWTVRDYIKEKHELALSKDELTWLSLHISRLINDIAFQSQSEKSASADNKK
ncbi:PRD domain-containing protein [Serratia entomophila]|uniref:PRD domain-containing protein n=1 Tax=Serratia entomophila TaxID=42906 RepID=UPI00217915A4|nr:PRD domain-containing protein [Serratia entomophila]CAI1006323.1 Transcription antiterminator LicT [Serratia entomophila]CAI1554220.1 Transcription antiterminator LicT [Serratia entomophila]CAI1656122.1 Transcription antiterminator LicT [Serratia entomophila]CAI1712707.1 Transcription antiterminator LicT [Serratia entomophila]CAI1797438.1 Transcription antiterminator LicT [Serratia entomophila]